MKATNQYFPVVLFIRLHNVVSLLRLWRCNHSFEKHTLQYFRVLLCMMPYKQDQNIDSVDEIIRCNHLH